MENQVLSIEQMKHLQELGINTSKASMCWTLDCNYARRLVVHSVLSYDMTVKTVIPTFTLQDVLDILPETIVTKDFHRDKVRLVIDLYFRQIGYAYSHETIMSLSFYQEFCFEYGNLIDAAYEMLCWCIGNGYIAKNE